MPGDRLAVYTVMYPGVEPYLPDWWASIRSQTDRDFDLWISLDGLSPVDAVRAAGDVPVVNWLPAAPGSSPAGLRSLALRQLALEYSGVVLVDSDDILAPSRVAAARRGLAEADLVACALRVADAAGRSLGPVLGLDTGHPDWETLLPRHNVFGLSNTAFRSDLLQECLPIPEECILVDWLLATRAWGHGGRLRFDSEPRMTYRQHPANVARVLPPFAPDYVLRATQLVLGHYALVLDRPWKAGATQRVAVAEARTCVRQFERAVTGHPAALARYVAALNDLPPRCVWWWCVANPELEDVWKN